MKMSEDQVDLYNLIFFTENPLTVFEDPSSIHYDYHLKVSATEVFKKSMIRVSENRSMMWAMSQDQLLANTLMAYYASFFYLMAADSLVSTFYNTFPTYCGEVLKLNQNVLFRDIHGDTFLHYYAEFGDRSAIDQLYDEVVTVDPDINHPIDMVNLNGETIKDILMLK